jgi:hypothetical protein
MLAARARARRAVPTRARDADPETTLRALALEASRRAAKRSVDAARRRDAPRRDAMRARATTTTTRGASSRVRAATRRRARRGDARRSRRASTSRDDDGDDAPLSEASLADVVERLKRAEEDRERLRAALEAKSGGAATVKTVDELARETPRGTTGKARVDGVGKRETLFGTRSEGDAWLKDGMEFLVREQPSEAGGVGEAGMTEEEEKTVRRRAIVGAALTAAFVGLSQISIESPEPVKPLFFYLVPVVRSRELLRRAATLAEDGAWDELNSTVSRVVGPPNNVKDNLFKAAAYLSGSKEQKAREIAFDFLEYMEKVNYSKYFENMGAVGGGKAAEYAKFSSKASKSAIGKLDEFLALMDREAVQAAESQVMAFEAEFTKSAPETQDAEEPTM